MLDVSTFVDLDEAVIAFVHDLSVWVILGGTIHKIRWVRFRVNIQLTYGIRRKSAKRHQSF